MNKKVKPASAVVDAAAADAEPVVERGLGLASAIEQLQRIQENHSSRPWRLVIRKANYGGLSAHQTTEIQGIYAGFDWEAGLVVLEPVNPMTELSPEQVEAISKSVRAGSSWHAHERDKKLRERIKALEMEVAALRTAVSKQEGQS